MIGVDANGNKYYDHSLTEIEKGKLIDKVGALSTTLPSNGSSLVSGYKDTKLFSILQTNSSKIAVKTAFFSSQLVPKSGTTLAKSKKNTLSAEPAGLLSVSEHHTNTEQIYLRRYCFPYRRW